MVIRSRCESGNLLQEFLVQLYDKDILQDEQDGWSVISKSVRLIWYCILSGVLKCLFVISSSPNTVIQSLRTKVVDLERQLKKTDAPRCLICMVSCSLCYLYTLIVAFSNDTLNTVSSDLYFTAPTEI